MIQFILTLTGSTCFLFITTFSNAQQTGVLTIEAANFDDSKGIAVVHLFRAQDDIPEKPFVQATGAIENGKSKIRFTNIPYGDYAAILFHDENANGVLDHKFGLPNEPMGFSNEWHLSLFSGMPSFTKLKFSFVKEDTPISISIQ